MKKIIIIVISIVGFIIFLGFYTNEVSKYAVKEAKSKELEEFNELFLESRRQQAALEKIPLSSLLIDKFDRQTYDSLLDTDERRRLAYSIVVSNKWEYNYASFDVFRCIANLNEDNIHITIPNLDFLDKETRGLAMKYLKKASYEKQHEAMFILGKYYLEGKYVEKNEKLSKNLSDEAKKISNGIIK
jgi:hypothetical protein